MSSWITQPNKSKCIIVDVKYLAISSVTLAATGKEKILHISCPTFTIKPEYLFMYVLDTHILLQLMFLSLWLIQRRETKKHMHYLSSVYSTRACWIPKFVNLPTSQFMRWMKQRGIKVAGIVLAYNSIYQFEVSMQIWLLQDKAFMVVQWFGVSDVFYHELSMAFSVLPNSHLLKKARKKLNETVEIEAIPLPHRGTFRPFRSMLYN